MASTNFVEPDTSCHEQETPSGNGREDFHGKFVLFVSWPNHCFPVRANQCQYLPKRTKMSREIALTILIPLFIVSLSFFATSVATKFKQRRMRRTMERGVSDLLHQMRSRRSNEEESRSTRARLRADRGNRRKSIQLKKRPQARW
jgi:hypothetical protein